MSDDPEARRIFQDMLDRCGEAMLGGDMEGVLRWFATPNTVEDFSGRRVLRSEDETRALFVTVMARQREQNITHMIRRVTHAEFRGPDVIWATHETRYIHSGTVLSVSPHAAFSILHRYPDCWKVHHAQFTVDGKNPLSAAMRKLPET
ncbi:hypothetical protein [Maliponia aquimaris]|uniref:SnoaL-like domain-containing protein n=1 Tax=Maliponia aquimaris TaxID=1673631 RepID=A0A238KLM7_9RHOB|nr:hypothetical protein [Maliponia aquimaris]SMX43527.1 hypothetical protein MAA8898_02848 [Maliponia aquimaris]